MRAMIEVARVTRTIGTVTLLTIGTAACADTLDRLIAVDIPDRILEATLEDPAQASLLVRSAQTNFECAFGSYVVALGLVTDELDDASGAGDFIPFDRRDIRPGEGIFGTYAQNECDNLGVYGPVSRARWLADQVRAKLEGWSDGQVPSRQQKIATVAAYSGYALVLLGEGFCSAALDIGPELTRAQILAQAEDRFTRAITAAQAASSALERNWASIGRARTRLNLGRTADAVADAQTIPTGFAVQATADGQATAQRENRPYAWINRARRATVSASFRNLEWQGSPDPRVPVSNGNRTGADNVTPWWFQTKYGSEAASIPLATWEEAQLILAEVAGGQTAVGIINGLHSRAGLPPFTSTDAQVIAAQVREERRRELFLESHRINDFIRFSLPLSPPAGAPYPRGGVYGSTTCLPLPDRERLNNPNIPDR